VVISRMERGMGMGNVYCPQSKSIKVTELTMSRTVMGRPNSPMGLTIKVDERMENLAGRAS